jgi:hypothetical protein
MGGAFVLQLILTVLFMPESAYHRHGEHNLDTGEERHVGAQKNEKSEKAEFEHDNGSPIKDNSASAAAAPAALANTEQPKSFAREILPYDGFWDNVSYWRTLVLPFAMLASPVVVWATLLFTTCISWLVLISITMSQIMSAPPYNFTVSQVGACNLSSFVASLIATAAAGPMVDGIVKYLSKLNMGIFGKFLSRPGRRAKSWTTHD